MRPFVARTVSKRINTGTRSKAGRSRPACGLGRPCVCWGIAQPTADREVEDDDHRLIGDMRRIGVGADRFTVFVPGDVILLPIEAVGVEALAHVGPDELAAALLRILGRTPMDGQEVRLGLLALPLHRVDFRRPLVVGGYEPESGPHAPPRRKLGAHLHVAVLELKGDGLAAAVVGRDHARRIIVGWIDVLFDRFEVEVTVVHADVVRRVVFEF